MAAAVAAPGTAAAPAAGEGGLGRGRWPAGCGDVDAATAVAAPGTDDGDAGVDGPGGTANDAGTAAAAAVPWADVRVATHRAGADQDLVTKEELAERLEGMRLHARAREGRASAKERAAAEVATQGLSRALRQARRARVETEGRFHLRLVAVEGRGGGRISAQLALTRLFGEQLATESLSRPPLIADPPDGEAETEVAAGLTRAAAAWRHERQRQAHQPFTAGQGRAVELRWTKPVPPPPEGRVWAWGPVAADPWAGGEADGAVWASLLGKECRQHAVEAVEWSEVDVLTPVFVVRHPVSGKPRLVHDLRAVNCLLRTTSVDYERAAQALGSGRLAAKLDILAAFRHCSLPERDRRRLAFAVGSVVFRWRVLPFGASQSPELFGAALAAAVRRLRADGVCMVVYVDDILILAASVETLDDAVVRTMQALALDGWYVALDKCYLQAARVIPFLGVLVDLRQDCLRVSVAKAARLSALCTAMLASPRVSLRALQKLGGTLAFLATASLDAKFCRVGIGAATAEAERLPGRTVGMKGMLADDVRFWRDHARYLPERPPMRAAGGATVVCTDAAGAPLRGYGGVAWPGARVAPPVDEWLQGERGVLRERTGADGLRAVFGPLPRMDGESSAALETAALLAVLERLVRLDPETVVGREIYWYCDAQAAVGAVSRWRARAPGLAVVMHRLFRRLRDWKAVVLPHWVSRERAWMPAADWLSRQHWVRRSAEWQVPRATFEAAAVRAGWAPTRDLFAAPGNAVLPDACTRYPVEGARCNAFAGGWDGLRGWAFPPFSQELRVLRAVAAARDARCIVVGLQPRVPSGLEVVWSTPMADPLIDAEGHTAAGTCPAALHVYEVRSGT